MPSRGPTNLIGSSLTVSGVLAGEEDLWVEGRVDGDVGLHATLTVGPQAVVKANIHVTCAVVHGIVIGNITATESVMLQAGARMVGDITTPRLVLLEGALFRGSVQMVDEQIPVRSVPVRSPALRPDPHERWRPPHSPNPRFPVAMQSLTRPEREHADVAWMKPRAQPIPRASISTASRASVRPTHLEWSSHPAPPVEEPMIHTPAVPLEPPPAHPLSSQGSRRKVVVKRR
jgi:cytoskeletal protein CcmA (bactofilin family)